MKASLPIWCCCCCGGRRHYLPGPPPPPSIVLPPGYTGSGSPLPAVEPVESGGPSGTVTYPSGEYPWGDYVPLTVLVKAFRYRGPPNNDRLLWASSLVRAIDIEAAFAAHRATWSDSTFEVWDYQNIALIFSA